MKRRKAPYTLLSDWLRILQRASREGGKILSLGSLSRVTGLSAPSVRRAFLRLTEKRVVARVGPQLYVSQLTPPSLEEVAMVLCRPCYISFETALSKYGILSQSPQVVTCATRRKPKRIHTPMGEIASRHLAPRLFWGYRESEGILWAEPEKALLDWIYWKSKVEGKIPDLEELHLDETNLSQLNAWAGKYPYPVRRLLRNSKIFHRNPQ